MRAVNLIARDNGFGLSRNLHLLGAALREGGHDVTISAIGRGKLRKILTPWRVRMRALRRRLFARATAQYDVNLMLEDVRPEFFALARHNVLMPHPEWFLQSDREHFGGIDRVFALTHHAVPIFQRLGAPVDYVGFTSEDRFDAGVADAAQTRVPSRCSLCGASTRNGRC